ncbi:hypothetical protein [Erysipelothrix piscisicarius]|uniref:hypothetical protein n=1 Tax=Erysipelothrix piscisicarius TaxID=2485784 RepID=UPI002F94E172
MTKKSLLHNYLQIFIISVFILLIPFALGFLDFGVNPLISAVILILIGLVSMLLHGLVEMVVFFSRLEDAELNWDLVKQVAAYVDWGRALKFYLLSALAITIGLVLLLVPGIYIAIPLSILSFVLVDFPDDHNLFEKCFEISKGYRLRIFGFTLALVFIQFLFKTLLDSIFGPGTAQGNILDHALSLLLAPISVNYFTNLYLEATGRLA